MLIEIHKIGQCGITIKKCDGFLFLFVLTYLKDCFDLPGLIKAPHVYRCYKEYTVECFTSPRFHLIFFHDGCCCQVNMTIVFDTSKWFWITCLRRKHEQDSIFSDWIVGKRLSMLCLQLCVIHLVANWHDVFTRNSEFEVCSAAFWAFCNPCLSWVTPVFYSEMQVSWRVAKFLKSQLLD